MNAVTAPIFESPMPTGKPGDRAAGRRHARVMGAGALIAPLLMSGTTLAQLQARPRSVSATAVTITLIATQDIGVTLISAALIDGAGRAYDLAGPPRGINAGPQGSCRVNSSLSAGGSYIISIPFRAQGSSPPYALTLQFETPDRSMLLGCRGFTVSLDGLR
jgi:hypothetical protein